MHSWPFSLKENGAAINPPLHSKREIALKPATGCNPENKLQKPVLFSAPQKMTSRGPRLPRIPPQIHHVFTTANTLKLQISPIKTAFHHTNLFPQKTVESKHGNQPQRSSRLLSQ
jgi:hypothetical protein